MTSGKFTSFPIDEIWVDRTKRQRTELGDLTSLKDSIQKRGLINPPTIKRDGELIAGERRWTSCKQLGWTHIPVQFVEDLDELECHLIELEENTRRSDLTWQDRCKAVKQYHELKVKTEPQWSQQRTADALGEGLSVINHALAIAKELEAGNERVIAAPKLSVAKNIVARTVERRKAATALEIEATMADKPAAEKPPVPLLHADFTEWAQTYDGPKFNVIHCDFPYGIDADKHAQGAAAKFGGYADSPDAYWQLLEVLAFGMDRFVTPHAHLIFWFSMDFFEPTKERLTKMGWKVSNFPLIWFRSDNSGILPDPHRGPRRVYETALFATRGDPKVVQAVSNLFAHPNTKRVHMSEKPLAMVRHFLRMIVDENSAVLDPTCGSGNAIRAAVDLGAARALGLERNAEFHENAVAAWDEIG